MRSWRTWNLTSVSALEEWSGDSVVVRYAFVYWYGGSTCFQIAQVLHGVNVFFAGRDKTSSSELVVELGIKVNLHTHLVASAKKTCRATGMGYMFGPCTERCDVGFCFVFDMVWRLQDILRGLLHRSPHLVRGNVSRDWYGKHVSSSFQERFDNVGVVRDEKVS